MSRWLGIDSSNLNSFCGEGVSLPLSEALDGDNVWAHNTDETHYFILDLGESYLVEKVRGRSFHTQDPIDVNIYVSDSLSSWGDAVATEISTWQDNLSAWVEVITANKVGRYVKVEIIATEDGSRSLRWGKTPAHYPIFDVFGISVANLIARTVNLESIIHEAIDLDSEIPAAS